MNLELSAIRGNQGSRIFYVCNVSASILLMDRFHKAEPAADRAQRVPSKTHCDDIRNYIVANQSDYVLGALTFALDKDATFYPIESGQLFGPGTLIVSELNIFHSLDGQHRMRAFIDAVNENKSLLKENVAILIYIEQDLVRKRQMFSDMNATPKRVPKNLNIAFDNRDPFGRAAKELIKTHSLLKDRIELFAARVKLDSQHFYSLSSIQDTLKKLHVGSVGRVKNLESFDVNSIKNKGSDFFDLLNEARSEYVDAGMSKVKLDKFRSTTILFSSTTLRVIAGAMFLVEKELLGKFAKNRTKLIKALSEVDFKKNSKIFIKSGFISRDKVTPNARNQEIAAATHALFEELTKDL